MPAFTLPLARGETAHIGGEAAEALQAWLAPVGDGSIEARIGTETVVAEWRDAQGAWTHTRGERFRQRDGAWVEGHRYLWGPAAVPQAVVNLTLQGRGRSRQARVSNVFVAPAFRRQGWASALLARVAAEHPGLVADPSFSAQGAALVGHGPTPPARRVRP